MKRWLLGGAVALGALLLGAGAVMAQSPGSGGPTFLDRVAQKLGIETGQLRDAIKSARDDEIDARVQSGDLTQQQGERLKQKLDRLSDDFGFGLGPGPKGGIHRGPRFGHVPGLAPSKLADFLGISVDQLRTELRADDATLATVAQAHGKSRDDLKQFITDTANANIDRLAADGRLTQQRADDLKQRLQDHLDELIDARPGKAFRGHFRFKHEGERGPGASPTPGAGSHGPAAPLLRS
jgi:hypothetical protein